MEIKNKKRVRKWVWLIVFSPIILILGALFFVWLFADIPSFEELENPQSNLATQILGDDETIINTFHFENRAYSSYEEVSQNLKDALVATEDVRYYKHSGIDGWSLGRVAVKSFLLQNRRGGGGGSTITQQLAKGLFPRGKSLIISKFKEWITALKLERCYTKDEIMNMYLNQIFFGSNSYGIKSASNTFFGKLPKDLSIEESAVLVGVVNKPSEFNPFRHPEAALKRRNHVLSQMEKYGYITKNQYDSIVQLPIVLADKSSRNRTELNNGLAPYFRDMLRRVMNAQKPKRSDYPYIEDYRADSTAWASDDLYGWLNKNFKPDGSKYDLERDGLKIYTPINPVMQRYAEESVREHLAKLQPQFERDLRTNRKFPFTDGTPDNVIQTIMRRARRWSDRYKHMKDNGESDSSIEKSFSKPVKMRVFAWNKDGYKDTTMTPDDSIRYYKAFLRTALMAIEPESGYVRAYVGGEDYTYFKYDQVMQGQRQVGSTFKPFLYTLAMQRGFSPCDQVLNVSQTFTIGNQVWTPKSTDRKEWIGQVVTLKWGLQMSSNNISAFLMKQFSPQDLVRIAHNMGIKTHLEPVHSLCVGSADIPVYQMVSAYNTFPSRGMYVEPMYVLRIEDKNGRVLTRFDSKKREAINANTAYLMITMMRNVVDRGTAARLRSVYIRGGEIAGKTGTTNDQSDGWFIGYMPKLTVGVWVGAEDRQVHFRSLALGGGSNMALPIWGIFMKKVLDNGTLGVTLNDKFEIPYDYRNKEDEDGCVNLTNGEDFLESLDGEEDSAKNVEIEKDEETFIEEN